MNSQHIQSQNINFFLKWNYNSIVVNFAAGVLLRIDKTTLNLHTYEQKIW